MPGQVPAPDAVNPTGFTRRGSHTLDPKTQSTRPPYRPSARSPEADSTNFGAIQTDDAAAPGSCRQISQRRRSSRGTAVPPCRFSQAAEPRFVAMSERDASEDIARLERFNQELSNSLRRCRPLLRDYEARITETREGRYYAVRERLERAMSCHATDGRAAAAHSEMADRYEALAVVFGAKRASEFPVDYL